MHHLFTADAARQHMTDLRRAAERHRLEVAARRFSRSARRGRAEQPDGRTVVALPPDSRFAAGRTDRLRPVA